MSCTAMTRRRFRAKAAATYRVLFYTVAAAPLWGTALALAIVWQRLHL
jgi:hypothetical protein